MFSSILFTKHVAGLPLDVSTKTGGGSTGKKPQKEIVPLGLIMNNNTTNKKKVPYTIEKEPFHEGEFKEMYEKVRYKKSHTSTKKP